MTDTVRLKAPTGTDEANFGETRYRVHDDGTITVPKEIAASLMGAGFTYADPPPPKPSAGDIRIRGGVGQMSAGWDGKEFIADANGIITLPIEAYEDLRWHGFVAVTD